MGTKVKTEGMNWRYAQRSKHISEIQDNNLSENIFSLSPSEGCKIINLQNTNHCKTTIPDVPCSPSLTWSKWVLAKRRRVSFKKT